MYKDCQTYEIENAIEAYNICINLPCSVNLKKEDVRWITENIKDFFLTRNK
jgi:dTDP-4-amino-4,6-dideoxygalactose transaminase